MPPLDIVKDFQIREAYQQPKPSKNQRSLSVGTQSSLMMSPRSAHNDDLHDEFVLKPSLNDEYGKPRDNPG